MAPINLTNILQFIKDFIGWQDGTKPVEFRVLSQFQYRDGLLLNVSRESVTTRINVAQVSTIIWVPKNKVKPILYVFLDSLNGLGIRNLSHRIQILSSDRHLSSDASVKINLHLSESYYLGTNIQANLIIKKLIFYCHSRDYESVNWGWEIETCRKEVLGFDYTDLTQGKAREDSRFNLDRFELRYPLPSNLNPIILEKIEVIIDPKPDPPKSRVTELIIFGALVIGLTWVVVNR